MRRLLATSILTLALLTASGATTAFADDEPVAQEGGPLGIGLIIGSPTGVSAKYYLGSSNQAIDAAVGYAFIKGSGIHLHADYLWHPVMLTTDAAFTLPLHVGVGVRLLDHDRGRDADDDFHLGIRAPLGVTFDFTQIPLDVFVEIALIADFHPDHSLKDNEDSDNFDLDLNAGLGVRYYF